MLLCPAEGSLWKARPTAEWAVSPYAVACFAVALLAEALSRPLGRPSSIIGLVIHASLGRTGGIRGENFHEDRDRAIRALPWFITMLLGSATMLPSRARPQ